MGPQGIFEREQGPFLDPHQKNSCLIIVQNNTLLEKLIPKISAAGCCKTKWTSNSSVAISLNNLDPWHLDLNFTE